MSRVLWFSLLLSLPISAAIVPGPEVQVTQPVLEESRLSEYEPVIAFGDGGHLAVWTEEGSVRATRISGAGLALDATALVIAANGDYEEKPDVAFGNGRYLVVFETGFAIHYRFVSPDGSMTAPVSLGEGVQPRVEFGDGSFLVTWTDETFSVRSARVSPESPVALGGQSSVRPEPVFANGAFHVVTSWEGEIVVTRNGERRVIGTRTTAPAEPLWLWASSANGELVVVWRDGEEVKFVRGDNAVQSFTTPLRVDALDGDVLILSDDTNIYLRRIGSDAIETIPTPKPMRVHGAAGNVLVTHALVPNQDSEIFYVVRDTKTFTPLALAPSRQEHPDLVAGPNDVRLAVWSESGIGAALVHANGTTTPLGFLTDHDLAVRPHAAWNGERWLVTWLQGSWFDSAAFGRHVRPDGTFVEAEPFPIATGIFTDNSSVAWDGERFVFAFLRGRSARLGHETTVYTARIHPDRIEETAVSGVESNSSPLIIAGRESVLVLWDEQWFPFRLRGVLISRGGTRTPVEFPGNDFSYATAAAAWNGTTYVVAQNYTNGLQWFLVSESGVVTFPPGPAALPQAGSLLSMTALGDRVLLLAGGNAAILDPRGFVVETFTPVVPDEIPHAAGNWVIYTKATDAARRTITRIFVRRIDVAANPPRRRAVR